MPRFLPRATGGMGLPSAEMVKSWVGEDLGEKIKGLFLNMLNLKCLRHVQVENLSGQFDVFRLEVSAVVRSWIVIEFSI